MASISPIWLCMLISMLVGQGAHGQTLRGHSDSVFGLAFSPDGKLLASGGDDRTLRLWDVKSGKTQRLINEQDSVVQVAFAANGKSLLVSIVDKPIKVYDVMTWKEKASFLAIQDELLAVHPGGKLFATGRPDHVVVLRDIKTGKETRSFRGHKDHVARGMFSTDGKLFVTCGRGYIHVWDFASGKSLATSHRASHAIALSPDGKLIAIAGLDAIVTVWDNLLRHEKWRLKRDERMFSLAFSPDGTILAVGTYGAVLLLDTKSGTVLRTLKVWRGMPVFRLLFSPDGKTLAATGDEPGWSIRLWRTHDILPKRGKR